MKKLLLLTGLLCCFSWNTVFAQSPSDIVSKENVSIDMIKKIFENSYYEIKDVKPTYITIKDVFTIYIDLDDDKRYITLSVIWPLYTNFNDRERYELLNKINKEVLLTTAYINSDASKMTVKATIWLEGGNSAKNIVMTEKLFVKALNLILDKDDKKIIQ